MEQKKFMDIERAKFNTEEIAKNNTLGFDKGDIIQITEKVDGSNASFRYDAETNSLIAFSRKKTLDFANTLNGFYNWVQTLDVNLFAKYPNYVFFGEWLTSHTITYKQEAYKKFYFYDVYDVEKQCYLLQTEVKKLATECSLSYVKEYYYGEFISWEHCMSFMERESDISVGVQEGVVIKNQTKLNNPNTRLDFVLKLVNSQFSEIKKDNHIKKIEDPNKLKEKERAREIVEKIVTEQRVRKEILKMQDEGLLPSILTSKDMRTIAQNLPKRIYEDCLKEELEYVKECGEHFGKISGNLTMTFAKKIVLGI